MYNMKQDISYVEIQRPIGSLVVPVITFKIFTSIVVYRSIGFAIFFFKMVQNLVSLETCLDTEFAQNYC